MCSIVVISIIIAIIILVLCFISNYYRNINDNFVPPEIQLPVGFRENYIGMINVTNNDGTVPSDQSYTIEWSYVADSGQEQTYLGFDIWCYDPTVKDYVLNEAVSPVNNNGTYSGYYSFTIPANTFQPSTMKKYIFITSFGLDGKTVVTNRGLTRLLVTTPSIQNDNSDYYGDAVFTQYVDPLYTYQPNAFVWRYTPRAGYEGIPVVFNFTLQRPDASTVINTVVSPSPDVNGNYSYFAEVPNEQPGSGYYAAIAAYTPDTSKAVSPLNRVFVSISN